MANPNLFVITAEQAINIISGGGWLYREQTVHGAGIDDSGVYLAMLADTLLLKSDRFQFRIEQRGRDVGSDTGIRIIIEEPYMAQEQRSGASTLRPEPVERWRAVATLYNAEKLQAKREEQALIEQRWQAEQQRRNEENARRDAERERARKEREEARVAEVERQFQLRVAELNAALQANLPEGQSLQLDVDHDSVTLTLANGTTVSVHAQLNCDASLEVQVRRDAAVAVGVILDEREHCGSYECPCASEGYLDDEENDGTHDYVPQPQSDRHTLVLGTKPVVLPNDYLDDPPGASKPAPINTNSYLDSSKADIEAAKEAQSRSPNEYLD